MLQDRLPAWSPAPIDTTWARSGPRRPPGLLMAVLAILSAFFLTVLFAVPAGAATAQVAPAVPISSNSLLPALTGVSFIALIYVVVDFFKHVANLGSASSRNAVLTQLIVWGSAFVVMLLGAQAQIARGLSFFPGTTLASMDIPSLILLSLSFGSTGSFLYKRTQARDTSQSAATPTFLRTSTPPAPPAG